MRRRACGRRGSREGAGLNGGATFRVGNGYSVLALFERLEIGNLAAIESRLRPVCDWPERDLITPPVDIGPLDAKTAGFGSINSSPLSRHDFYKHSFNGPGSNTGKLHDVLAGR